MNLRFFDINLYLGRPKRAVYGAVPSGQELVSGLDSLGVSEAVVWHIAQYDHDPVDGNALIAREIAGQERLHGCWTLLPPQTREVIREDFFRRMKESRIVALQAFPDAHRFLMNRITFGKFLDEVSERGIPLLVHLDRGNSYAGVYRLLEDYPQLTCVLCDVGIWGCDRYTWPLLEHFRNVRVETSLLALEDGGVEATVRRFGAERLLFGTGFPDRYPEAAMLQLRHADIPDPDKEKIASGNLEDMIRREQL